MNNVLHNVSKTATCTPIKKPHGRELLYYHEIFGSFALWYWPCIEYCNEQFVSVTALQIFQTLWTQGIRTQRADVHVLPGNSGFIFFAGNFGSLVI